MGDDRDHLGQVDASAADSGDADRASDGSEEAAPSDQAAS